MIHSTVLETDKRISIESVVYRLREFTAYHLQGKENAMKSGQLMNCLGFRSGGSNRKMRLAAKLLLCEEGIPLISGPTGFYVAVTVDEMNEYHENLQARKSGIQRSLNAVNEIRGKWLKRPKGDCFEW